jgi:hypothetical protein
MKPLHIVIPFFSKIHINIIRSSTPRYSKQSLPSRFPDENTVCTSHMFHAPPSRLNISVIKSRRIRWAGYATRIDEKCLHNFISEIKEENRLALSM